MLAYYIPSGRNCRFEMRQSMLRRLLRGTSVELKGSGGECLAGRDANISALQSPSSWDSSTCTGPIL